MYKFMFNHIVPIGQVIGSMILGVAALAWCAVYNAPMLTVMIRQAGGVREWIVSISGSPSMELISRIVLNESSILLMFFTVLARIAISVVLGIGRYVLGDR